MAALGVLPDSQRDNRRMMFDHYIFRTDGDPVPCLPPERRGILGAWTPELEHHARMQLLPTLTREIQKELGEPPLVDALRRGDTARVHLGREDGRGDGRYGEDNSRGHLCAGGVIRAAARRPTFQRHAYARLPG